MEKETTYSDFQEEKEEEEKKQEKSPFSGSLKENEKKRLLVLGGVGEEQEERVCVLFFCDFRQSGNKVFWWLFLFSARRMLGLCCLMCWMVLVAV